MMSEDLPEASPTDRELAIEGLLAYDFSQLSDIVARREAALREKLGLPPPQPPVAAADRRH